MTNRVGQRVRIMGGMQEFVGKFGTIIDVEQHRHEPAMYRVKLDKPVAVPHVGDVTDDLWQGPTLKRVR